MANPTIAPEDDVLPRVSEARHILPRSALQPVTRVAADMAIEAAGSSQAPCPKLRHVVPPASVGAGASDLPSASARGGSVPTGIGVKEAFAAAAR